MTANVHAANWLQHVRDLVRRYVKRNRLPDDIVDDIAQDVSVSMCSAHADDAWEFDVSAVEKLVATAVRSERHLRTAEKRGREGAARCRPQLDAPPRLCRRLSRIGHAGGSGRFGARLMSVALLMARCPRAVPAGKFRLFHLAWVEGANLSQVGEFLGVSRRAARERLRRLSLRIEARILRELAHVATREEWRRVSASIAAHRSVVEALPETADTAYELLGRVIDEHA